MAALAPVVADAPPPFLGYGRQLIEEDDIAAVVAALRSDHLAHGPCVERFERALAQACGAREAVACSSGTAALQLALAALDVGPGDVCVVPAVTFLSTATAARMLGAEVRFADVDADTGLMTPDTLAAALGAQHTPWPLSPARPAPPSSRTPATPSAGRMPPAGRSAPARHRTRRPSPSIP
jgi:hypothetical protein